MKTENSVNNEEIKELPDEWWYKIYAGVIITTILVITALWAFSKHFST